MTPRVRAAEGVFYRDYPSGRKYIVLYTGSDGKQRSETLASGVTLAQAKGYRAQIVSRMSAGERIAPTGIRFSELAARYLEEQSVSFRQKTMDGYRWGLAHSLKRIGRHKVHEIDVNHIARMVMELRKEGLSDGSIKKVLSQVSRIMAYAVRRGFASRNPVSQLERGERPSGSPRQLRILSSEEIGLVLEHCPEAYRTEVATAIFTGLRRGEQFNLLWQDVDFEHLQITVRGAVKTPAGLRSVVLIPSLAQLLAKHSLVSPFNGPLNHVFTTATGRARDPKTFHRMSLGRAIESAGLEHCRWHDLRHTFASILIGQGMDVTYVADQMGHADPSVTLSRYAKLYNAAARRGEGRAKLEAQFGGML